MSSTSYWGEFEDRGGALQDAVIDPQGAISSFSGGSPLREDRENRGGGEDNLPAASIKRGPIYHSSQGNTHLAKDNRFVRERQRSVRKGRLKPTYSCVFLGERCGFMPDNGFPTCSRAKEDASRHLNMYQCGVCGKRFGKKSGLDRHQDEKIVPCRPEGGWDPINPGLLQAAENVRNAKGYAELMAASDECRLYCDMDAIQVKGHGAKMKHAIWKREHGAKTNKQKRVTQDSDGPEPFSPSPVVLQPPCQPYVNDGMTSALTMGRGEFDLEQQGGSQAFGRDIFRQGSPNGNVTRRDYRNDADGCYPDTTGHPDTTILTTARSEPGMAEHFGRNNIYTGPNMQGGVDIQVDSSSSSRWAAAPISTSLMSTSCGNFGYEQNCSPAQTPDPATWSPSSEGTMAPNLTHITNYMNSNSGQRQDIEYGHGAGQYGTNNHLTHPASLLATGNNQALDLYGYQRLVQTPATQFGDLQSAARTGGLAINQIFLGRPGAGISSESYQHTEGSTNLGDNQSAMEWGFRGEHLEGEGGWDSACDYDFAG